VLAICGLLVTNAAFDVASQMSDMNMPEMHHARVNSETLPTNANEIVIENFAFQPATLTVKVGTKVTWVNRDDEPHTATATDKRFNSKTLDNGEQFSTEFNQPGTYNYYCALHPKMTGQIIVK
jgi:plastocyanin